MSRPLSIALVWHMHQPYYREDGSGRILLPWVRRRASKDYVRMIETAMRFPQLRTTMNFVPTLLEQLDMYTRDGFDEPHSELCLRDAHELTPAERAFLVRFTRVTDHPRRVAMFAPFYSLLQSLPGDSEPVSDAAIRDLQVWAQLVWIDPADIDRDAALSAIVRRASGFDEEVKRIVDERQLARVRDVLPALREAIASGCIEPMTSPYAHPILPLLIDQESARVARPEIELPGGDKRFRHLEDARAQLDHGIALFERYVGTPPAALWPSECAVSPAAAAAMATTGTRWAISDEGVLAASLGQAVRGDTEAMARLYSPYREASGLHMVFRDSVLSNRIGFDYPPMRAEDAVADLMRTLEEIASAQPAEASWLVVIALDGENCWDYYEDNGAPFLDGLYAGLEAHPRLRSVHVGAFLAEHAGDVKPLDTLWTGSWIDADFTTWVGEPAHTRAWELLHDARDALDRAGGPARHPDAHRQLMITEGSDWFWWFSARHESGVDAAWDELFRTHLRRAYTLLGVDPPAALDLPILSGSSTALPLAPLRAIAPVDGRDREWEAAGIAPVPNVFGAMQPARSSVDRIRYGTSDAHLHVRVGDAPPAFTGAFIDVDGAAPVQLRAGAWSAAVPLPEQRPASFSVRVRDAGRGEARVPAMGVIAVDRMRGDPVVIVAAECAPFAAAGDLAAAVRATVTKVLALGRCCVLVIPAHASVLEHVDGIRFDPFPVSFGGATRRARVHQGSLDDAAVLAVESEHFGRSPIYGESNDGERYLFFGRAVAQLLERTALDPTVVHGFEWESAAALALVSSPSAPRRPAAVLSLSPNPAGYEVTAELARGAGLEVASGAGSVDLLDAGRAAADAVGGLTFEADGALASLYGSAAASRQSPTQTSAGAPSPGRI